MVELLPGSYRDAHSRDLSNNLERKLLASSRFAYNSAAGFYRICGVPADPAIYGDDCIGKLRSMIGMLPSDSSIQYLTGEFGDLKHVAAVVDGYYVDPFLFQTTPIDLEELADGKSIEVRSMAYDQKIQASLDRQILNIKLLKVSDNCHDRTLIEYTYDLGSATLSIPADKDIVNLSVPYKLHFVSRDDTFYRVIYSHKKDSFNFFVFSSDTDLNQDQIRNCAEQELQSLYGLTLDQLREYFRAGNEMQRYLLSLQP